jgi:DnaK suppressor protein
MLKKDLLYFQNKLLSEKKEIENALLEYSKELSFVEQSPHPEEEAEEVEELLDYEAVRQNQQKRLDKINKALDKIKKGKYGICEKCGNEIEKEVLEIYPESEFCKKCKIKMKL